MSVRQVPSLSDLYEADETAWLDAMSELAAQGRTADMDLPHLSEYLADMANRDRREVTSRLRVLLAHLLKWTYQPEKRTGSWQATIRVQRGEVVLACQTGTLRNHALAVLSQVYARARLDVAVETELPAETFPVECPWTLDQILAED